MNPYSLTKSEAQAYFDKVVHELFGISGKEFLDRIEEFRDAPNFDTVEFLLPLSRDYVVVKDA